VGIYIKSPSSKSGINSLPILSIGQTPTARITSAPTTAVLGYFKMPFKSGLYPAINNRLSGFFPSGVTFPLIKYPINTGITVTAKAALAAIA
jgi:hypothetical protein